jgi:PadR family transcriptional regulator, regulatory protein PadR
MRTRALSVDWRSQFVPEAIDIQLKKGVLGMCVLALLARGDNYAYEIASKLAQAVGMGEGTIYPLMRRMQSDGLVATYLEESPSGPPRKYYRLTDAGHASYVAQLSEWRAFTSSVEDLIGKNTDQTANGEAEMHHDA